MDNSLPSSPSRRSVLLGGALASAVSTLEMVGPLSTLPARADVSTTATPSDIQFDIGAFTAAPTTINGILVALPPVQTQFLTARLLRKPGRSDVTEMNRVLNALEAAYPWGAAGLVTFVSYSRRYFNRLNQAFVRATVPNKDTDPNRSVLQEAVASPTDVVRGNGITKARFQVPVRIETNDLLFTLRSDSAAHIADVINFFGGSNRLNGAAVRSPAWGGLLQFTSSRNMFTQIGLPRQVADQNNLPFRRFINPQTPMWMGFADQQVDASGPAAIVTFAGNAQSHKSTANRGDYFDNGSIQHLSHVILDMLQFFDMANANATPGDDAVFLERVQYMFHSPAINPGNADQLTNGGGPAFLRNDFRGTGYARQTAQGIGTEENERRIGHLSTLHRSSRTSGGIPLHIRMDGPGFDSLDVPNGAREPKLQFTAFVPHADFFAEMRSNQASLDLQNEFDIEEDENGLERFLTATRRQNFLVPPRRHRSFPLVELGA